MLLPDMTGDWRVKGKQSLAADNLRCQGQLILAARARAELFRYSISSDLDSLEQGPRVIHYLFIKQFKECKSIWLLGNLDGFSLGFFVHTILLLACPYFANNNLFCKNLMLHIKHKKFRTKNIIKWSLAISNNKVLDFISVYWNNGGTEFPEDFNNVYLADKGDYHPHKLSDKRWYDFY